MGWQDRNLLLMEVCGLGHVPAQLTLLVSCLHSVSPWRGVPVPPSWQCPLMAGSAARPDPGASPACLGWAPALGNPAAPLRSGYSASLAWLREEPWEGESEWWLGRAAQKPRLTHFLGSSSQTNPTAVGKVSALSCRAQVNHPCGTARPDLSHLLVPHVLPFPWDERGNRDGHF